MLASKALSNDFLDPPGKGDMEEPLRLLSLDFRGLKLGEFELVREIGRGAAGVVYLGEQPALKRKVAIKILVPQLTNAPRVQERFEREALAASRLRHPSIVSVLAFGEVKGLFYIAMEYVEGRSLHQHIEELRIARKSRKPASDGTLDVSTPEVAADLALKLAEALQYCHGEGVLHRDIKPHNILIDTQGLPRIVDFGLAKDVRLEGITEAGLVSGTLNYMSPEQAQARSNELDARTDVYSLGAVLYEMLTLRQPLEARTDSELLRKVLGTRPIPPHHVDERIPKALSAICMRALRKSPEGRYEDAGEFAQDLRAFLAGHKLTVGARIWVEDAYRYVFVKRPWIAVTGVVGGFLLVLALSGRGQVQADDQVLTPAASAVRDPLQALLDKARSPEDQELIRAQMKVIKHNVSLIDQKSNPEVK
jgi:serine/threonine protein kinase